MERLVGKKAPAFHLEAVSGDGETFFEADLRDYQGQWLALLFYPMDFTFVCPTELTAFSSRWDSFQEAGCRILAVSADSKYTHQAWIRNGLGEMKFPIAADKLMTLAADYGVLDETAGIALRGLFIISPEQEIRYAVIHDADVGRSVDETLRVLAALQSGGMCPANWIRGEKLIQSQQWQKETVKNQRTRANRVGKASEKVQNSGIASVKIYTLPDCGYCRQVKAFLDAQGVVYEEIDLQTSREGQNFMDDRGYTGTPVTVVGDQELVGLNLKRLAELI